MSVHVTCPEPDGDRILARLARTLCRETGWSLSDRPDAHADVNILVPYLLLPSGWDTTKLAAFFTHPDDSIRGKGELWPRAAASVALRTCSARQYLPRLQRFGPSALVTPPLDRERFRPYGVLSADRLPRIGISGWNYPGGRKGPKLAEALADSWPDGARARLSAIGDGWPAIWPTRRIPDAELQDWYRTLDVYVCTSLVEGVGYGPLEALACGVRVVVPIGVGIFDDLPDMEGISRYPVDDVRGMLSAVDRALAAPVDQDALRFATEKYTPQAWAMDWVDALEMAHLDTGGLSSSELEGRVVSEDHVLGEPIVIGGVTLPRGSRPFTMNVPMIYLDASNPPDWPVDVQIGATIVAYGEPAKKCARRLILSIEQHAPQLEVEVISNEKPDVDFACPEPHWVNHPDTDLGGRGPKTLLDSLVPEDWDIVVYLDADTELVGPIDGLIAPLLDGWEWVICPNPGRYALIEHSRRPDNQDEIDATVGIIGSDQMLQYNGGVFAYRRTPQTRALMAAWHAEWQRWGKRDQAALDRALWANPVRTWIVGREFNCVLRYDAQTPRTAILHHSLEARRWKGIVTGRLDEQVIPGRPDERWASLHPSPDERMPR